MVEQGYVSDELTHFVGRCFNGQIKAKEKQYKLLKRILQSGELGVKPATQARMSYQHKISSGIDLVPEMVCFCDIPIKDLPLHMGKYSRFGMAFLKSFLVDEGANPVFYVASNSLELYNGGVFQSRAFIFDDSIQVAISTINTIVNSRPEKEHPQDLNTIKGRLNHTWGFLFWNILNYLKFYQEGLPVDDLRNYYMEREWRLRAILSFKLSDVKRVFIPRNYKDRFKADFPEYSGDIIFS